jgi:mannose-6-phosphate isomerase-like protein (cupin superfamily)
MKHIRTAKARNKFAALIQTRRVQSAMMTLRPGDSTGESVENEHPNAEQWLFVISGTGRATVGRRTVTLAASSLLLIEAGEPHKIANTGRSPLVTLNFYSPPAYTKAAT